MTLTLFDTFSGVSGFSLAGSWAGFLTVGFCEREPYCQAVIRKHWPGVPIFNDIRTLTAELIRERTGIERIDCLTGGPPCQPVSCAGKRKGEADERWLWGDFLRLVQQLRPLWVLAENPPGLISLPGKNLDWILCEMEAATYQCQTYVMGADDVGAPHQRKRVWIVAKLADAQCAQRRQDTQRREHVDNGTDARRQETASRSELGDSSLADADLWTERQPQNQTIPFGIRGQAWNELRQSGFPTFPPGPADADAWSRVPAELWPCVPRTQQNVRLLADGLSPGLVRRNRRSRNAQLKALGNAVIPYCAYFFLQAIADELLAAQEGAK